MAFKMKSSIGKLTTKPTGGTRIGNIISKPTTDKPSEFFSNLPGPTEKQLTIEESQFEDNQIIIRMIKYVNQKPLSRKLI